ncbi:MAG: YiaA/YiaB family inner membrane protein [Methylobacterium sp.]
MTPQMPHTPAWKAFTFVSFGLAVAMLGIGVFFAAIDTWTKGYLAMAALLSLSSAFTLAKTLRDEHETNRLINRIENAETERTLREAIPGRV